MRDEKIVELSEEELESLCACGCSCAKAFSAGIIVAQLSRQKSKIFIMN